MSKVKLTKEIVESWIERQWDAQQVILECLEDDTTWICNAHNANCEWGVHVPYRAILVMAELLEHKVKYSRRDDKDYNLFASFKHNGIKIFALTSVKERRRIAG
jgi:hypothetical protein